MKKNEQPGRRVLLKYIAAYASCLPLTGLATSAETINEALRIRVDGRHVLGEADLQARKFTETASAMAEFRKNIVSIHRNASVRLTVETINSHGHATVVTTNAATSYHSLSPSRLSVSADGTVTAAPSVDSQSGSSGDVAVLVVFEKGAQQAWNKVFFNVVP